MENQNGESGIRTRGTSFPVQQFSKLSLSTTQPSLQQRLYLTSGFESGQDRDFL